MKNQSANNNNASRQGIYALARVANSIDRGEKRGGAALDGMCLVDYGFRFLPWPLCSPLLWRAVGIFSDIKRWLLGSR
ncbi:MAG: hypothetical protein E7200_00490 [Selenomonas ruminantium]|nr:hypothetical protein [Selenomonas ruminantium]